MPSHLIVPRSCLTGSAPTTEDTKTNTVVVSATSNDATHNNQPKVVVNGEGGVREETRPGRNVWGSLSHCLGRQMEASNKKNREMGWALGVDGRQLMIYYATTNQKQAFATEGGMKERCGEHKAQGKHYAIVLGALLVDRWLKI